MTQEELDAIQLDPTPLNEEELWKEERVEILSKMSVIETKIDSVIKMLKEKA